MISFFLAQIQPVEPTVVNQLGQEFVIDAGVLSENGRNIFHTFEQFGLTQEQMANFLANPETENIFNRVNGNDSSFIDGFIKVTGGNPDFYFLNPNGIIFGQHAQINVPAAFYASTATSLQFGNDGFPLYAGLEWFATPFAIGQGIESSNGDPTFLIFGAGLHNPILNLGTIQADKIDLSGGSVVSLGELQAEDVRFSVGFNSIPWKIATDRDYWTIVPRSAFSSVRLKVDLIIEEDFKDKDIYIFSDPVFRRLFIQTLTFKPFNVSSLLVGLGDVIYNYDVRVLRVGTEGKTFLLDLNLAIKPNLPDEPVVDNPVIDLPDEPVVDNPVIDLPDDLVVDNPVIDLPDEPVVDNPVIDLPDDPVVDNLVIDLPDNSVYSLVDNLEIDKISFNFLSTAFNFQQIDAIYNFLVINQLTVCYYSQFTQDGRRCLLRLNIQNQDHPEMTKEYFYNQIRGDIQ